MYLFELVLLVIWMFFGSFARSGIWVVLAKEEIPDRMQGCCDNEETILIF